ncbi:aromatic amino acid ammonia-lyase [uncultured Parasutterella sp.]|uniref:HAL/PAL/TAL family ammonia-lyase n=1 Tax=uncultured Parasutterella sp. TaxID=1263098 RepID=UPI0025B63843|nr:aromatic amino acid ammonia-lyase [uncultured Parasutterella sp.]
MKTFQLSLISIAMLTATSVSAVELNGSSLTQDDAWAIAEGAPVSIAPEAMDRVKKSYELVLEAAKSGKEIYGLTVGVGLNKDHKVISANGELSEEVKAASRRFNYSTLRSHSIGAGPALDPKLVRLAMVIRLNTLLKGGSGVQPRVAELYEEFLNKGVTPVVPTKGSLGDADITLASHVGSAMIGEWKVINKDGKQVASMEVLKEKGIKPLVPEGKDALGILSNSSVAMAMTMDAAKAVCQILKVTPIVYGISLEGLNGNVAPFLPQTVDFHPFPGLAEKASELRKVLAGSYLWDKDESRRLQDPLCFRTTVYTLSEAQNALNDLDKVINVQINGSDDNPGVMVDADRTGADIPQIGQYFIETKNAKGAIIPTANFEVLPVALAVQRMALALGHVGHNSAQRTMRLDEPQFTDLSRYLAAEGNLGHAFGATEDTLISIYSENIDLANPVSLDSFPVEGNIEDSASNLPRAAQRLKQSADNTFLVLSMELLHNTQAADLRKMKNKNFRMSPETEKLYKAYRAKSPFVDQDRIYSIDLENGDQLLKNY